MEAWDRLGEIAVPTLLLIGELDLQYIKENVRPCGRHDPRAPGSWSCPAWPTCPTSRATSGRCAEIAAFVASV